MSQRRNAYNRLKHEETKHLTHKAKEVFISLNDIFEAHANYSLGEYWKFVRDKFRDAHAVEILDTEKLVMYHTLDDKIMKVVGHIGYSLTEPKV